MVPFRSELDGRDGPREKNAWMAFEKANDPKRCSKTVICYLVRMRTRMYCLPP